MDRNIDLFLLCAHIRLPTMARKYDLQNYRVRRKIFIHLIMHEAHIGSNAFFWFLKWTIDKGLI